MSIPFPPMKRPLVAILRGVKPDEVPGIVGALLDAGMTAADVAVRAKVTIEAYDRAVQGAG